MEQNKDKIAPKAQKITAAGGKYLSFVLGGEEYGVEVMKVREIIGFAEVTAVPQTPDYVKGVMNLRGQIIPVIDLKQKFGMEQNSDCEKNCIIVVEVEKNGKKRNTGIVVDSVHEVRNISSDNIEAVPEFGSSVNTDFIIGIGKVEKSVKILLDIEKVLSINDIESVSAVCA